MISSSRSCLCGPGSAPGGNVTTPRIMFWQPDSSGPMSLVQIRPGSRSPVTCSRLTWCMRVLPCPLVHEPGDGESQRGEDGDQGQVRSEEHTSELQSPLSL